MSEKDLNEALVRGVSALNSLLTALGLRGKVFDTEPLFGAWQTVLGAYDGRVGVFEFKGNGAQIKYLDESTISALDHDAKLALLRRLPGFAETILKTYIYDEEFNAQIKRSESKGAHSF